MISSYRHDDKGLIRFWNLKAGGFTDSMGDLQDPTDGGTLVHVSTIFLVFWGDIPWNLALKNMGRSPDPFSSIFAMASLPGDIVNYRLASGYD